MSHRPLDGGAACIRVRLEYQWWYTHLNYFQAAPDQQAVMKNVKVLGVGRPQIRVGSTKGSA